MDGRPRPLLITGAVTNSMGEPSGAVVDFRGRPCPLLIVDVTSGSRGAPGVAVFDFRGRPRPRLMVDVLSKSEGWETDVPLTDFLSDAGPTVKHVVAIITSTSRMLLLATKSGDSTFTFDLGAGGPIDVWSDLGPAKRQRGNFKSYLTAACLRAEAVASMQVYEQEPYQASERAFLV
jgi:hypothetical protein